MNATFDFDNPWRPIYEWRQAVVWLIAAVGCMLLMQVLPIPPRMALTAAIACFAVAVSRGLTSLKRTRLKDSVRVMDREFITVEDALLAGQCAAEKNALWLGRGFPWTDVEASRMHALIAGGVAQQLGTDAVTADGAYWLQGMALSTDTFLDLALLDGHTLVAGTTRVGKTRGFELLINQAIARDEPVIVLDPKGDESLAQHMQMACARMGRPNAFVYFHPAHPERSVSIDPLRNWNRKTELASRIAALIPSETGADPFTAFGWKVLNDIVGGLLIIGQRPNMVLLRKYIEGGPDELLLRALRAHFKDHIADWEQRLAPYTRGGRGGRGGNANTASLLDGHIAYYKEVVSHEFPNPDLDGLISTHKHNREHFQKMIASLIPVLSMLTSGPLGSLLSPQFSPDDPRLVTDMAQIIRGGMAAYIGLDSLSDGTVGSAIGSVFMADATAVAGDIFNYAGDEKKIVNMFVDESAEVLNKPTVQLLNKAGGAGFRMFIAAQTFADFAARLGDENKARQVLANTNNKIIFRVLDAETQKYISEGVPKIKVKEMSLTYGHGIDASVYAEYGATYREQAKPEDADLIPPAILSELPPLHYFARLAGGKTIKGYIPIIVDKLQPGMKRGLSPKPAKRKRFAHAGGAVSTSGVPQ